MYSVNLSERAQSDLDSIQTYIAKVSYPSIAQKFVADIRKECRTLSVLPQRGTARNELQTGLRTMGFRRAVTISFRVTGKTVTIVRIFYRGRNITRQFSSRVRPE